MLESQLSSVFRYKLRIFSKGWNSSCCLGKSVALFKFDLSPSKTMQVLYIHSHPQSNDLTFQWDQPCGRNGEKQWVIFLLKGSVWLWCLRTLVCSWCVFHCVSMPESLDYHLIKSYILFFRSTSHPVTVTTRIITFLAGNPNLNLHLGL